MPTVKIHPLAEIIAKKLFGIESVPPEEARKMVSRAAKAAVKWHEELQVDYEDLFSQACPMIGNEIQSQAISEYAYAMRKMAGWGRIKITDDNGGRMVYGKWLNK